MTLYRKYRAQNFQEIVGQDHVVQILKQSVLESKFAHAYLFTGPRGTGKTSMARILSKALNCQNPSNGEPCNECSSCSAINAGRFMDLIEIDAASNRGIDEIRGLKEGISFLPVEGKFKIYIIDEVHMLTEPAFNALLKTLEEPPSQVLFILATTEPHKLPLTIISRTQRFDFKLANSGNLNQKLSHILNKEGVMMEESALEIVIKAGQGSYRDAETVLEKVLSAATNKEIKKQDVEAILGYVDSTIVKEFLTTLLLADRNKALDTLHHVAEEGSNLVQFLKESLEQARLLMIQAVAKQSSELRRVLLIIKELNQASVEIKTSLISVLPIEVAIINITMTAADDAPVRTVSSVAPQPIQRKPEVRPVIENKPVVVEIVESASIENIIVDVPKDVPVENPKLEMAESMDEVLDDAAAADALSKIQANWDSILQEAKKFNHFLTAILTGSQFATNPGEGVVLKVTSAFHKKQLDGPETRKNINKIIATITGSAIPFKCIIDKNFKAQKTKSSNAKLVEELLS